MVLDPRVRTLYTELEFRYRSVNLAAHGFDHLRRVLSNAILIGEAEKCRLDIVCAAALLHDIGFIINPDPSVHHLRGAEICSEWLGDWTALDRKEISNCVLRHKGSYPGFGTTPETLEEQVICDADSLEKVGYIGLLQGVRTYVEFSFLRSEYRSLAFTLAHMAELKEQTFYTQKGLEIAESRKGCTHRSEICRAALAEIDLVPAPIS